MSSLFRRIINSALITFIVIIVSLLSYFTGLRTFLTNKLALIGVVNQTLSDSIQVFIIGIVLFFLLFIIDFISTRYFKSRLISYKTEPPVTFSSDASGERIHDFQRLRANAKESIFVMGVGMTYFSSDYSLLEQLLKDNISVRLLMINPSIIVQKLSGRKLSALNVGMTEAFFDDYFLRTGYSSDIRSSLERLTEFIRKRKESNAKAGRIELRVYQYFVPLNFTIADEKRNGAVLLELALPFSDHRVRLNFTAKDHRDTYVSIVNDAEKFWANSNYVLDDQR